jgi:hypothetical protein
VSTWAIARLTIDFSAFRITNVKVVLLKGMAMRYLVFTFSYGDL